MSASQERTAATDSQPSITLDVSTMTLGEMSAAEIESGVTMDKLLTGGRATRRLLALWVHERRSSAKPRSWLELSSLRLSDLSSSTSPSPADSPSERSSD